MKLALVLVAFGLLSACGGPDPAPVAPETTASAPLASSSNDNVSIAPPTDEVYAKVCRHEHVDATSDIFLGIDAPGNIVRLVATPTRTIADMGNLIFDNKGEYLGMTAGSEGGDPSAQARLMGGASVGQGSKPLSCATYLK